MCIYFFWSILKIVIFVLDFLESCIKQCDLHDLCSWHNQFLQVRSGESGVHEKVPVLGKYMKKNQFWASTRYLKSTSFGQDLSLKSRISLFTGNLVGKWILSNKQCLYRFEILISTYNLFIDLQNKCKRIKCNTIICMLYNLSIEKWLWFNHTCKSTVW